MPLLTRGFTIFHKQTKAEEEVKLCVILVRSDCQDPYYNLALEEYLFFQRTDLHPLFFCGRIVLIVIGRNQNTPGGNKPQLC